MQTEPIRLAQSKYECPFCQKVMENRSNMTRHIRIHTGEKPFACEYCNHSTRQKNDLKKHYESRHSTEKPFACEYCNHCTKQKSDLKKHYENRHSTINIE